MKKFFCGLMVLFCMTLLTAQNKGYLDFGYQTLTISDTVVGDETYNGFGFTVGAEMNVTNSNGVFIEGNLDLYTDYESDYGSYSIDATWGLGGAAGVYVDIAPLPLLSLYASAGFAIDSLHYESFSYVGAGIRGKIAARLNFGNAFALTAGISDTYCFTCLLNEDDYYDYSDTFDGSNSFYAFIGFVYRTR